MLSVCSCITSVEIESTDGDPFPVDKSDVSCLPDKKTQMKVL